MSNGGTHWECMVSITFAVDPAKDGPRYEGDAEIDFANRAVCERLKPELNKLVEALAGGGFFINAQPEGALARRCFA